MIKNVHLDGYRSFDSYQLSDLSRVNLLVGLNNSGKTSLLESIHLLACNGDFRVFTRIAWQRGEIAFEVDQEDARWSGYPDMSHFFYGHAFAAGSEFKIRSENGTGGICVRVLDPLEVPEKQRPPVFGDRFPRFNLGLMVERIDSGDQSGENQTILPATGDGLIPLDIPGRYRRMTRGGDGNAPVQFIATDSLDRASMSEMWDRVITEGREKAVVNALRIIEPKLTNIAFLTSDRALRQEPRGGIVVGCEGSQRRYPLGSYGEGMRRLFALALSLTQASGGLLLVDEIDTGLHYSVLEDVWHLVVQSAIDNNVQVFVTTHSLDCIRALANLCVRHPDLGDEVSLQKIDRELRESVALNAERIVIAAEQDIEVR